MKALVSGATGCIGSHIVEGLIAGGHQVRALARPTSDVRELRRIGADVVTGDLCDAQGLAPALRGVELVLHNAALVSEWGPWEEFAAPAVEGTRALLGAALRAGVARFVHMSSASVYGLRRIKGRRVTEALEPPRRPGRWNHYARAKIASERIVLEQQRAGRIGAAILRPTVVYGPRDRVVVPRLAGLLRAGHLRLVGSGVNRMHLVHAADVAEAACRAGSVRSAVGGIYHLDGPGDATQREFLAAVAELAGAPPPLRGPPLEISYALAFLEEARGHLLRRREVPRRTRYLVALCGGETTFDPARAERDLGWKPRPFAEGWKGTRSWWLDNERALSPAAPWS